MNAKNHNNYLTNLGFDNEIACGSSRVARCETNGKIRFFVLLQKSIIWSHGPVIACISYKSGSEFGKSHVRILEL